MSFWKILLMICSNGWVLTGATYISIILTIYFSVYKKHKKIKFVVIRNNSNYIIALWNASNQTIFREDISYFYAYGNVNCKCDVIHANDPDISLEYEIGEDSIQYGNTRFNRHVRKIDFAFDFLPTRTGYIIHIDNRQKKGYYAASLLIKGRIRGEKRDSIYGATDCIGKGAASKTIIYAMIFVSAFFMIIGSIQQVYTGIYKQDDIMWLNGLLAILLFSAPLSFVCYMGYITSMPFDIFCKYYKYIRKSGYRDITHEVNKISSTK